MNEETQLPLVAEIDEETGPEERPESGHAIVAAEDPNPMRLIEVALSRGLEPEKLERLFALQERWEANQARKAYVAAMAAFKADLPEIIKNKHVKFTTQKGTTEYDHATLDHICAVVTPKLAAQGLSHHWDLKQEDGKIAVTCWITHVAGHREGVTLRGPSDETGSKNNIQAVGSTIRYLKRYTLEAACGIASADRNDDDGARAGERSPSPRPQRASEAAKQAQAPKPASDAQPNVQRETASTFVLNVEEKSGTQPRPWKAWLLYARDHEQYVTEDEKVAKLARSAQEADEEVEITWQTNAKGKRQVSAFVNTATGEAA